MSLDNVAVTSTPAGTAPSITSFSPSSGLVGDTVTINGSNFGATPGVKFNGIAAASPVVNGAGTQMAAFVPSGATTGKITVEVAGEATATSATDFTVIAPDTPTITLSTNTITGLSTLTGSPSTATNYTVTGTNLGATPITVTPSSSLLEVGTNGTDFTNSLSLPAVGGVLSNNVFVRVVATNVATNYTASISHVSGTASNSLAVSGAITSAGTPGLVYWSFDTDTPSSGVPTNWTVGPLLQGNNNGTTALLNATSASSGYTNPFGVAASGGNNAGAAARVGALVPAVATNGSAYFEVNIVPPATNTVIGITNISFGSRSTSTGPQAFTIRSSADGYASDLFVGSVANTGAWAMKVAAPVAIALSNGTNTFRIYGYNGSGSASANTANWRIDDLTFALGTVNPSSPAINLNPGNLSGLVSFGGTPSSATNYTVTGTNLGANDLVIAPGSTNLQISTNSATGFTNQLTFAPVGGVVAGTTIYVRISDTAALGALNGTVSHVSGTTTNILAVTGTVYDPARGASTNSLVAWDAFTQTNYGPSPWAPTLQASNLIVSNGLTRGTGLLTTGTAAARAWGGVDWSSPDVVTAVASNQFASFTVAATNGYALSISSISKFDYRRPGSGPSNGVIQVQVGASNAFVDLATVEYASSSSSGASLPAIDLSTNAALQNVAANTPVTFRIVNFGGTNTSGTWYIFDVGNNPNVDFEISGSLAPSGGPVAPSDLSYSPSLLSGVVGTAITNMVPTVTGTVDDYSVSPPLPSGLSIDSTTGVISGSPTAVATSASYTVTASNAGGSTTANVTISVTSAYEAWAGSYSLTGADALPTADPDKDGLDNNNEYAFGTNPTVSNASLLSATTTGGNMTVTWIERNSGFTYAVQSTVNLATTGFANDGAVTVVAGPTDPAPPTGYTRKQFTVPASNNKFFRVRATAN